jgi:hypothetical protein
MKISSPLNLYSIYTDYLAASEGVNNDKMLTSVLVRYLVPAFGGPSPKGKRATSEEIKLAIDYLQQLTPNHLFQAPQVLEETFEKYEVDKNNRRIFRSILKKFVEWSERKGYFKQTEKSTKIKNLDQINHIQFRQANGKARKDWSISSNHGRVHKKPYRLMGRYSGCYKGELVYPDDYINSELEHEINEFEKFRREHHNCASGTISKDLNTLYQFLGWLHRYKGLPLEELRLTSIISFCQLNVQLGNFPLDKDKADFNQIIFQKAFARQVALEKASECKKLILEYLDFLGGHPSTKIQVLHLCIALAKFIFRDEIGNDDYATEQDIPMVKMLLSLHKIEKQKQKITPDAVPHENKSVTWETVLQVLEKLRLRAITEFCVKNRGTHIVREARVKSSIVEDLQDFLSLAFMVLVPPDRARTYYELEIGKTLLQGTYQAGIFIPTERMESPELADWYIRLNPQQYKTGKSYGESWIKMPNIRFSDNSTFYEYIDKWLSEGREYKQKCNHNFFFRGARSFKPLTTEGWNERIVKIFDRETGVPVAPKELRKIYVVFLKNNGAPESVLEGAAAAMHHSRRVQTQIYDVQNRLDKIAPVFEFNEQIFDKFWNSQ